MLRTIRRLALVALPAAALLALYVPAGQAQPGTATTLPATSVSVTSAQLNGSIATGGAATEWQFQYGRTNSYGHTVPLSAIPAGQGTVHVAATVFGLSPKTTYHFRVLAITGIGRHYVETDYGADRSFKTKPATGRLLLVRRRLNVSRGLVSALLRCHSGQACHGRFLIDTPATTSTAGAVVCATKSFNIPAGKTLKTRTKVRPACLALLRTASKHRIRGTFYSSTTTGQLGQTKGIALMLA